MDQGQQAPWRKRAAWISGIILTLVIVIVLIRLGYAYRVTGFGQYKVDGEVQPFKTLWDWLNLLIVPIVLAIGGYLFTRSENLRTQRNAEQQRTLDREIADQRRQDDTLQTYLDQIGQYLLNKDRPLREPEEQDGVRTWVRAQIGQLLDKNGSLRESKAHDDVRTLARARTLTVLPRLDGKRKGTVLHFLYEAELISNYGSVDPTAIYNPTPLDLKGADLSGAIVNQGDWRNLSRICLSGANLRGATICNARLEGALLRDADLRNAKLLRTDFNGADLREAKFQGADLSKANLKGAQLSHRRYDPKAIVLVGLEDLYFDEIPPDELERRDETFGSFDSFEEAANLTIHYMAETLEGATMFDGQTYEKWLNAPETRPLLEKLEKVLRGEEEKD